MGERGTFVASFAKGLRVIQAFDQQPGGLTLTDVAVATGLDRAAARRYLHTLVELGYAATDSQRRFRLTPRVLDLGFAYLSSAALPEVVAPELKEASMQLQESCSAAVLDGAEVVYVARVAASRIMSVALGVGARLPAAVTSMGRVLLAHLEASERQTVLQGLPLEPRTRFSVTSHDELAALLHKVRQDGFAIVDQELEEGLRSIAVPLRGPDGKVCAAINASTQANRTPMDELAQRFLPRLQQAAQRVERVLAAR